MKLVQFRIEDQQFEAINTLVQGTGFSVGGLCKLSALAFSRKTADELKRGEDLLPGAALAAVLVAWMDEGVLVRDDAPEVLDRAVGICRALRPASAPTVAPPKPKVLHGLAPEADGLYWVHDGHGIWYGLQAEDYNVVMDDPSGFAGVETFTDRLNRLRGSDDVPGGVPGSAIFQMSEPELMAYYSRTITHNEKLERRA